MTAARPLLLRCSPRKGGNCDTAADNFLRNLGLAPGGGAVGSAQGTGAPPLVDDFALRDYSVLPCMSCGHCTRFPGKPCPLEAQDDSTFLIRALREAPALCFVAPIYFYHLPAQIKALIDRSQTQWALTDYVQSDAPLPAKKAWVILVAAREKGEKLFEGSLLTLKYWLKAYGVDLAPPLCLYGMDEPGDLAADADSLGWIRDYAATARHAFRGEGA